jgi:acyl carrier protein
MDNSHTKTENVLLEIWPAVLNLDRVGIHDDFLDLGGDSFAAMRCINQIKATFGVELPPDVFFAEPASIAAMAREIDRMRSETRESATAERPVVSKESV